MDDAENVLFPRFSAELVNTALKDITRNLLILGTATTAKKAPLPDPLYVYSTKTLSLWSPTDHIATTVSHRFAENGSGNNSTASRRTHRLAGPARADFP